MKSKDVPSQRNTQMVSQLDSGNGTADKSNTGSHHAIRKSTQYSFDENQEMAQMRSKIDANSATSTRNFAKNVIATHEKMTNKSRSSRPDSAVTTTTESSSPKSRSSVERGGFVDRRKAVVLQKPVVAARVPLNSTNDNNFDNFVDRGIGSRGPTHKDIALRSKGGSISTWVKLMGEKYGNDNATPPISRPASAALDRRKYVSDFVVGVEDVEPPVSDADQPKQSTPANKNRPASAHPRIPRSASEGSYLLTANESFQQFLAKAQNNAVSPSSSSRSNNKPPFVVDSKVTTEASNSAQQRKTNKSASPYAFSSLPYMTAPLLPRAITQKSVQIREDSKSPTHRHRKEADPASHPQQQKLANHGGDDNVSTTDERLIEATAGMSYTVSASDLFSPHYNNHGDDDEAVELAPMESLGDEYEELSRSSSYDKSPLMAISPFEATASPFPHRNGEFF